MSEGNTCGMKPDKKHSAQIGRVLRTIEVLAGHEFDPLSTGEVARAVGVAPPVATRDLQAAEHFGWVEKTPDGQWRLAPRHIINIAIAFQHGAKRSQSRLDDRVNNYTRSVY